MLCKKCNCEIDEAEEICSRCGTRNMLLNGETHATVDGNHLENQTSAEVSKADFQRDIGKRSITEKNNYDGMVGAESQNQNSVIKSIIIVMAVLILTISLGTIAYISSQLRFDSSVRHAQLIELGATEGISKISEDSSIGNYYYVSGVTEYLPLCSIPENKGYEELGKLYNGSVVQLQEKTNRLFWQVIDYSTGISGYVAPAYLTSDANKVIMLENETLESKFAVIGEKTKIETLYYVLNSGEGVSLYSTSNLDPDEALSTLIDGNTVGFVDKKKDSVWRVYDYKSSQYGYMESKYLTDNLEAMKMAKEAEEAEKAKAAAEAEAAKEKEEKEKKKGPEYVVTWSESALSVRDGPTKEDGKQVGRVVYGDVVEVVKKSNDTFWYVYIPDQGMYGYVKAVCIAPFGNSEADDDPEDIDDTEDIEDTE